MRPRRRPASTRNGRRRGPEDARRRRKRGSGGPCGRPGPARSTRNRDGRCIPAKTCSGRSAGVQVRGQGDIGMALKINVTWPASLRLCIPSIDCRDMEIISPSKATKSGSHITINHAFGRGNRVCDDDRYRITQQSNGSLERCQPCARFDRTLIILLESPHKDEYGNDCIDCPKKPAQGTTGNNIRDHLMSVIRSCRHIHSCLGQETKVILANPIQFQCSLVSVINSGAGSGAWKKTRDAVWKALWDLPSIRDEFKRRLERYHSDFIINACTHDLGCDYKCLDENGGQG